MILVGFDKGYLQSHPNLVPGEVVGTPCACKLVWTIVGEHPGTVNVSIWRLNWDLHQEVCCGWARVPVQKESDVFMPVVKALLIP